MLVAESNGVAWVEGPLMASLPTAHHKYPIQKCRARTQSKTADVDADGLLDIVAGIRSQTA